MLLRWSCSTQFLKSFAILIAKKFMNRSILPYVSKMQIFIEIDNKEKKMQFNGTVSQLLQKLQINSETVLVARNNTLVTEDDTLSDTDEIKLLSVISGG